MKEKFDLEKMFDRIYTEYGFDKTEVYVKNPITFKVTCYTVVSLVLDLMVNGTSEMSEDEAVRAFQSMEDQCLKFLTDQL